MRSFLFFFILGSLLLSAGEPGREALSLLQGLRDPGGRSEVVGQLGLSRFCGPRKREVIKEAWEARAAWARQGKYSFELVNETIDEDLAAVLVAATTPDSPLRAEILSLALVRRDGQWKVAPVEGSFENTALGFGNEVMARAGELERWMARERVTAVARLQSEELRRFREATAGAVPPGDLRDLGPDEALARFITAAESGNVEASILWQGFLERDELPEADWEQIFRVTRLGLAGADEQEVWRLLTSRKVMKVILDDLEEGAAEGSREILVGFLSSFPVEPMKRRINPVRFQLIETAQGWRVELPSLFAFADEDTSLFRSASNRSFDWEDREGVKRMFGVFESRKEKIRGKDPQAVIDGVIADLRGEQLESYLRRLYRLVEEKKEEAGEGDDDDNDNDDDDEVARLRARIRIAGRGADEPAQKRAALYEEAVQWWDETLDGRATVEAELSKLYLEGPLALAILSLPPSSDTWKPRYLELWLRQGEDGWMILPGRREPLTETYPEEDKEAVSKLAARFAADEAQIYEEFLDKVLKVVALDAGEGAPASDEEAVEMVRKWREVARSGGMMDLLQASAVRQLPEEPKGLLRDLGYVRKGAADASSPDQVLGSRAAGRFRAVSLMVDRGLGEEMACPLVFVVPVKGGGHRVLVDIELPLETNRGITLLNAGRLEELEEAMSPEDFAHLQELRQWHQETARPVWEKWQREKEAAQN